jgi:hypothetical protein
MTRLGRMCGLLACALFVAPRELVACHTEWTGTQSVWTGTQYDTALVPRCRTPLGYTFRQHYLLGRACQTSPRARERREVYVPAGAVRPAQERESDRKCMSQCVLFLQSRFPGFAEGGGSVVCTTGRFKARASDRGYRTRGPAVGRAELLHDGAVHPGVELTAPRALPARRRLLVRFRWPVESSGVRAQYS